MPARALHPACSAIGLALLLAGCSSGGEASQPMVTATETITAPPPESSPTSTPKTTDESTAPTVPEPEEPLVDDVEAYGTFTSADGVIVFAHPGGWTVDEQQLPGLGTRVTVTRAPGVVLLDLWFAPLQPQPSRCEASSADGASMVVLEAEPFEGILFSTASTVRLEIASVELDDGSASVALLQEDHVARGCLDLALPIGGATFVATTPWDDGADVTVHDVYPGGADDFVGSYEHGRIVELLRSLEIRV